MIFRIVTKHGMTIDVHPVEIDFNFLQTCGAIRLNGCFANNNVYVPWDSISFMVFGDQNALPIMQRTAPSTETKQ